MTARHGCISTVSLSIREMTENLQAIEPDVQAESFEEAFGRRVIPRRINRYAKKKMNRP